MVDYHELMLQISRQQQEILEAIKDSGISVSVDASDIKIGAVEIQDKEDDKRVDVENINEGMTAGNQSLLVKGQSCDAAGAILNPRKEDGHGSESGKPSFVEFINEIAGFDTGLDAYKFAEVPPSSLYGNLVTLPGTLPSQAVRKGATIKAHKDNVGEIMVNGMSLEAGESIPINIDNLSKILITGTAGDKAYYLGS